MNPIDQLIEISQFYGKESQYVIAGGGNTSYKNGEKLWVKASGFPLATITESGFAVLDRNKLSVIAQKQYSENPSVREAEVKDDLAAACITKELRPSVETSLHNALSASYVVHLHPTGINGLLCSNNAESETIRMFGEDVLYIPYIDPGYTLFKEVLTQVNRYREKNGAEPKIIFLQNHGVFVGAETIDEIKEIYASILETIRASLILISPTGEIALEPSIVDILPALRMMLSKEELKTLRIRNSELIDHFLKTPAMIEKISTPFTPDIIVYCKSKYLYLDGTDKDSLLDEAAAKIDQFIQDNGYTPKILLVKNVGVIAVGDSAANSDIILDVFEDMMKIAWLAQSFGGEHPMTAEQVAFIDNWEVENYRRSVSSAKSTDRRIANRTVIVTGAAQGFGEGIAECLVRQRANVVIADLNETAGVATAERLSAFTKANRVLFVKTNVADMDSLSDLMYQTVAAFGGIDLFVSNAGVLRAGGLEDMTPEDFEFVTRINYNAYFYCVKVVSQVMKLQTRYAPSDYYADIIQINSKSGLRGSKANFAYAGGKFGGIGLTQSFALELAPYRVKVNSICPGNFYEGPLWSDPDHGLFVQYLRAGKVPGAETIEDVRRFYMAQVPMNKGTNPEDVAKALFYLVEQTCETGQALPVTGGQVMMS